MKSERKHVLESNLLADKIEAQIIKFKKALPAIVAVVVVSAIVLLVYGVYTSMQDSQRAKGWTSLYFADTNTSDLDAISSDFGDSPAGLWARQIAGDAHMARAMEKVYLDRSLSDQYFQQALDEYKTVAEKSSDSFLKGRALYGAAQAAEGLADREQAIGFYRKIILLNGLSPEFVAETNKRVKWLETSAGEEFYVWFKNNRPSAPVLNDLPTSKPPLPSIPDMKFPTTGGNTAPNNDLPAIPTGASEAPAGSTDTPVVADPVPAPTTPEAAPATPAAETPASETPAAADAPAEPKP